MLLVMLDMQNLFEGGGEEGKHIDYENFNGD